MGIVVTVFMILTLLLSVSTSVGRVFSRFQSSVFLITFLLGVWNAFWYGAQHLSDFWGMAAMMSGILMMITSITGLPEKEVPVFLKCPIYWVQSKIKAMPQGFHEFTLLMLFGCACLYSYMLIMLNLQ